MPGVRSSPALCFFSGSPPRRPSFVRAWLERYFPNGLSDYSICKRGIIKSAKVKDDRRTSSKLQVQAKRRARRTRKRVNNAVRKRDEQDVERQLLGGADREIAARGPGGRPDALVGARQPARGVPARAAAPHSTKKHQGHLHRARRRGGDGRARVALLGSEGRRRGDGPGRGPTIRFERDGHGRMF